MYICSTVIINHVHDQTLSKCIAKDERGASLMLVPITSPHTPGVASAHSSETVPSPTALDSSSTTHLRLSGWSPVPRL